MAAYPEKTMRELHQCKNRQSSICENQTLIDAIAQENVVPMQQYQHTGGDIQQQPPQ
jgi:predicted transcriptional regulator